jgi:hypothetical protein
MPDAIDVGLQDPDLDNSPIATENVEDAEATWAAVDEAPVCYFNGVAYDNGTIVKSGNAFLECERGVWVPIASSDPDNP